MRKEFTSKLKAVIYREYNRLVAKGKQNPLLFPEFKIEGNVLYWSGEIEDEEFNGKRYLLGEIIIIEKLRNIELSYSGYVIDSQKGIELFENYTERNLRSIVVIPLNKGLVADMNCLNRNKEHDDLESKTPEEIIKINFDLFPVLMRKFLNSSKTEYQAFYLWFFARYSIFF